MVIDQKQPQSVKKKVQKSVEKFKWGDVTVLDIVPEDIQESEKIPVFFAPGWSITIACTQEVLLSLADYNNRVITLNHKRIGGIRNTSEEMRKAHTILSVLHRKNIDKADGVGYSEGCTNLLLAACLNPNKFRNIVLVNPPGLSKKWAKLKIVKGFLMDAWGIKKCKNGYKKRKEIFKELLKYIFLNPIRSYREVDEITHSNLVELLKNANNVGIKVSIVHNINDHTFDFTQANYTLLNAKNIHIEEFYAIEGGHFGLIKFPRRYMSIIAHALKMFKKSTKPKT